MLSPVFCALHSPLSFRMFAIIPCHPILSIILQNLSFLTSSSDHSLKLFSPLFCYDRVCLGMSVLRVTYSLYKKVNPALPMLKEHNQATEMLIWSFIGCYAESQAPYTGERSPSHCCKWKRTPLRQWLLHTHTRSNCGQGMCSFSSAASTVITSHKVVIDYIISSYQYCLWGHQKVTWSCHG